MEDIYESKEWIYRLKGSRMKISFIAREEKTVNEYIRLVSKIVKNPPYKLLKVKKCYINTPPYPQEQEMVAWYKKCCVLNGVNPDE